jgi:hypothetical protein
MALGYRCALGDCWLNRHLASALNTGQIPVTSPPLAHWRRNP